MKHEPLRIAVLTSFPRDPYRPNGGVEAVSVNLVQALTRITGLEVHVVTSEGASELEGTSSWANATIHRLPRGSGSLLLQAVGRMRRQIQEYLRELKPDVVHAHDTYGIMVKGAPWPRVFTVHGFIHEDTRYAGGRGAWLRSKLWQLVETSSWADQPHIVSISPYVRERLRGIARGVIHDIENPIAPECFEVHRDEQPARIFCAAAICKRKNTLGLLEAFDRLARTNTQAQLRWAGPATEPEYEKSVRHFIEKNALSSRVKLLGALSAEHVRRELAQASVFALVSFEEGAPMGIAEAMAAGVPVITSNRCGMPYMFRHAESGFLVNPCDPTEIAQCLKQLLDDASMRRGVAERARQVALDCFHPDRVAERMVRVYRRVASRQELAQRWH